MELIQKAIIIFCRSYQQTPKKINCSSMKVYIIVFFSLFNRIGFSQSLEGYYNLSQHEAPTHLYLLDDNTFYYYSIFGAVDLEIYGVYAINEGNLKFYPREDQLQSYVLYGRANETLKDSVAFNYMQSDQGRRTQLVIGIDKQWYKRAIVQINADEIQYKVNKAQIDSLEVGYPAHFDAAGNFIQVSEIVVAQIPKGMNDFLLPLNRYATMRTRFSKIPMQINGDVILSGEKEIQREDLKEGEHKEIAAFLKARQLFAPTTESRGNTFKRIAVVNQNRRIKLQLNKKEQWVAMDTYSEDGTAAENGSFYYDTGKLKKLRIEYPNTIDGENTMYYENGELKGILKEDGEDNLYYENGQLRIKRSYRDGLEEGEWKSFYFDGSVIETGTYNQGSKIGEWKRYDKTGALKTENFPKRE